MNSIKVLASKLGGRLFRNNVGQAWTGISVTKLLDGSMLIKKPRPLNAGLCVGSSDLIGFTSIKITPDMVNTTVAVFTAIETKQVGKLPTLEQRDFIAAVTRAGGIAFVARSDSDFERGLNEFHERIVAKDRHQNSGGKPASTRKNDIV